MLKDYEIKALEHTVSDYNEWAQHAVNEGLYPDIETALHYKASRCAERMIYEHENLFGEIVSTLKDDIALLESQEKILREDTEKECKIQAEQINALRKEVTGLNNNLNEAKFLKKVAEAAGNQTKIDEIIQQISDLQIQISEKETEKNTVIEALTIYYQNKNNEAGGIRSQIETKIDQLIADKIEVCYSMPGRKNRNIRDAEEMVELLTSIKEAEELLIIETGEKRTAAIAADALEEAARLAIYIEDLIKATTETSKQKDLWQAKLDQLLET